MGYIMNILSNRVRTHFAILPKRCAITGKVIWFNTVLKTTDTTPVYYISLPAIQLELNDDE